MAGGLASHDHGDLVAAPHRGVPIAFAPTLAEALNLASGLLLVGLGLYVAMVRPRRRGNLAFALFAASLGVRTTMAYLTLAFKPHLESAAFPVASIGIDAIAALSLAGIAPSFPRPLGPGERRILLPVALVIATLTLVCAGAYGVLLEPSMVEFQRQFGGDLFQATVNIVELGMLDVVLLGMVGVLLLLASRYPRTQGLEAEADRRQTEIASVGLLLFPGIAAGSFPLGSIPAPQLGGALVLAGLVLVAMVWLRQASVLERPASRRCRNLALLALALPLLAALFVGAGGSLFALTGPQFGLARTASVLVFGYAILRSQLLGVDVRVRWTIKQSTVATMFIVVFFAASEVTKDYFASAANSSLVGIAAAGALVFVMAPLQRAAERVASVAVPPTGESPASSQPTRKREVYADALRVAMRDRALSPEEDVALAHLAQELGLGAGEAMEARQAVEREARVPPRPAEGR